MVCNGKQKSYVSPRLQEAIWVTNPKPATRLEADLQHQRGLELPFEVAQFRRCVDENHVAAQGQLPGLHCRLALMESHPGSRYEGTFRGLGFCRLP